MLNNITRFEYFIKKTENMGMYDLWAIGKLKKGIHPVLNVFEKADILHIIRYKKVDITRMGYCIWIDDKFSGLKHYNNGCKTIRENLSKDQWMKLMDYYKGYIDNMDKMGDENVKA